MNKIFHVDADVHLARARNRPFQGFNGTQTESSLFIEVGDLESSSQHTKTKTVITMSFADLTVTTKGGFCDPFWSLCLGDEYYGDDETINDSTTAGYSQSNDAPKSKKNKKSGKGKCANDQDDQVRQYFLGGEDSDDDDDERAKKTFRRRRKKLQGGTEDSTLAESKSEEKTPKTIYVQMPVNEDESLILPPHLGSQLKETLYTLKDKLSNVEVPEALEETTIGSSDDSGSALTLPTFQSVLKETREPLEHKTKPQLGTLSDSDSATTIALLKDEVTDERQSLVSNDSNKKEKDSPSTECAEETSPPTAKSTNRGLFSDKSWRKKGSSEKETQIKSRAMDEASDVPSVASEGSKTRFPGLGRRGKGTRRSDGIQTDLSSVASETGSKTGFRGFGRAQKDRHSVTSSAAANMADHALEEERTTLRSTTSDLGSIRRQRENKEDERHSVSSDFGSKCSSRNRHSVEERVFEERPPRDPKSCSRGKLFRRDQRYNIIYSEAGFGPERRSNERPPTIQEIYHNTRPLKDANRSTKQRFFAFKARRNADMPRRRDSAPRSAMYSSEFDPAFDPEPPTLSDVSRRELELRSMGAISGGRWGSAPRLGGRGREAVVNDRHPRSSSRGRVSFGQREGRDASYQLSRTRDVHRYEDAQRYDPVPNRRRENEVVIPRLMAEKPMYPPTTSGDKYEIVDLTAADGIGNHYHVGDDPAPSLPASIKLENGAIARKQSEKVARVKPGSPLKSRRSLSVPKQRLDLKFESPGLLMAGSLKL
jgi:hypothetical protein